MSSALHYQLRKDVAGFTLTATSNLRRFCSYKGWTYSNSGYDKDMGFNVTVKGKGLKEVHLMPYLRYDFVRHTYQVEKQDDGSLLIKFTLDGNPLVDFYDEFNSYFWRNLHPIVIDYMKKEKLLVDHTIEEVVNKAIKSRKRDPRFRYFRDYAKVVRKYLRTKEENLELIGVENV